MEFLYLIHWSGHYRNISLYFSTISPKESFKNDPARQSKIDRFGNGEKFNQFKVIK